MARRKHEPHESPEPANDDGSPVFASEADAENWIVDCVQKLQNARPAGDRGKSVSRSAIERKIAVDHAHIGPDSLDRYLVNLLSDGRLGVTAGRWWVRRKASPILVLGLLVLLTGCGSNFSTANTDVGTGGAPLASAGATAIGTGGAALASAGATAIGTGGAALASAGATAIGTGGAALEIAGATSAGVLVTAGSPGLPTGGSPGTGERWPACLAEGCGASCRTLSGSGWCSVMATCLADNGCVASNQPNCTGCSALPDGIDCECSP